MCIKLGWKNNMLTVVFFVTFRGYGLGSVFNSLLRFLKPAGKQISKLLKKPTAQKVLKTVGKEAASTGAEIVLEKMKGNKSLSSVLNKRIQQAKTKISEAVTKGRRERMKTKKIASKSKRNKRYGNVSNRKRKRKTVGGESFLRSVKLKRKTTRQPLKNTDYYKSVFD